ATVKQIGHEPIVVLQVREHAACFGTCQHHRQFRRTGDSLDTVDKVEFSIEYLLVKKQQRAEGLILRRSSDVLVDCEMSKEFCDFFLAHLIWMTLTMKKDEAPYPIRVSFFGANRIMLYAQVPTNAVE